MLIHDWASWFILLDKYKFELSRNVASFLRQSQNEAELNNSSSSLVRAIVRIQRIRASSGEKADRSMKSIVA